MHCTSARVRRSGALRGGWLYCAAVMLPCYAASAADAGSTLQGAAASGGDYGRAVDEIVVSARRRDEALQDVPDAISVFSGDTLEDMGATDLGGLNQALPNFNLRQTQQPGTAFIAMRGVSMQRFQEPSVAVIVDGMQLTSPYQILQSLHDVEQIEVLRGPQGALYGRNAIGGAISIRTRQPAEQHQGLVRLGVAEGNTREIEGRLSGPVVRDRAHFSLVGGYRDTDGLIDNVVRDRRADFEEMYFVRGRLQVELTPDATLDLRLFHEDRDGGVGYFVNIPSGDVNDAPQDVRTGTEGRGSRELTDVAAQLRWDFPFAELSLTTTYSEVDDEFRQDIDLEAVAALEADQFVDVRSLTGELRLTSPSDRRLRWQVGGYYADIDQDVSTLLFANPCYLIDPATCPEGPVDRTQAVMLPFGINENNNETFALFSQVNYDLMEDMELTLGLRYDRDRRSQLSLTEELTRQATFSALQPKVSLAYRWSPQLMTYATASRGFRSGAFNGTDYIMRKYDAETLWNFETGVKADLLDRRLRMNLAAFYMRYSDRQEYVLQPGTGAQALFNVPRSSVYGFEGEAFLGLNEHLDVSLGLGLLETEVRRSSEEIAAALGSGFEGNKLPGVPHMTANVGLQYRRDLAPDLALFARSDWSLKRGLRWSLGNVDDRQEAIHLVNLRVGFEYRNVQLTAYAENLFDKAYFAEVAMPGFGSINPVPGGFPAQPRQVGVHMGYRF